MNKTYLVWNAMTDMASRLQINFEVLEQTYFSMVPKHIWHTWAVCGQEDRMLPSNVVGRVVTTHQEIIYANAGN